MMGHRRHRHEVGVPTLLRIGPYRFFFWSDEHEPPHVHVESAQGRAVVELAVIEVRKARGYTDQERAQIREIVVRHREAFLRRWYGCFGG
jgi:hypothetical protein